MNKVFHLIIERKSSSSIRKRRKQATFSLISSTLHLKKHGKWNENLSAQRKEKKIGKEKFLTNFEIIANKHGKLSVVGFIIFMMRRVEVLKRVEKFT